MTAPTPEAIAALVSRLRGIYPVGPGNPPEFGVRTFDNLPPIQAEAADTILALLDALKAREKQIEKLEQYRGGHLPSCGGRDDLAHQCECGYLQGEAYRDMLAELDAAQAEIAEWHDEVARFSRGWERRAEPYSALEDEFEQMGHAWANYDKVRAELEAAQRERGQAIIDRDRYWKCSEDAERDLAAARAEVEALRADKERMDYLDQEWYREECWRDAGMPSAAPFSLFRQNLPITREAIDAARARWEKQV